MDNETITLTLRNLGDRDAQLLARICKRFGFSEARALTVDNDEAQSVIWIMHELQMALAEAGYEAR